MATSKSLHHEFDFVRKVIFPRWDRKRRWRVRQVNDLHGAHGECDRETTTIKIAVDLDGDELTALLVHEVAHAVAGDDHGERWKRRMCKAAETAESVGRKGLADLLRADAAGYGEKEGVRVTPSLIYREIEELAAAAPHLKLEQVLEHVGRGFGLSPEGILRRARRAKVVLAAAQREARRAKESGNAQVVLSGEQRSPFTSRSRPTGASPGRRPARRG